MQDSKRYGKGILETPEGRWYWHKELQSIDYVPKGTEISIHRILIRCDQSNFNDAIRIACLRENDIRKGKRSRSN